MKDYFDSIVEDYEELSSQLLGNGVILKLVATPFLEHDRKGSLARAKFSLYIIIIYSLVPMV